MKFLLWIIPINLAGITGLVYHIFGAGIVQLIIMLLLMILVYMLWEYIYKEDRKLKRETKR